eukprot:CAMPEP_0113707644 /NCGR_PEP_ID=MMETSP0038_2-20120614/28517_1 /TAXON_ID=2898 /ORGANISM="Cryptomonas paramecium" /LENGTH=93 /DNA_ID=CAMNT_0000633215 /DNA_START=13 /DNA_END=294 /DNA_ORIENTATION=+ /assembly_acc=CAM_ASM_000170
MASQTNQHCVPKQQSTVKDMASQTSDEDISELSYIPASRLTRPKLSESNVIQFCESNLRGKGRRNSLENVGHWLMKQPGDRRQSVDASEWVKG